MRLNHLIKSVERIHSFMADVVAVDSNSRREDPDQVKRWEDAQNWAKWILAEEQGNKGGIKRTPPQIAVWIAGLVGATEKTVALLNLIPAGELPLEKRVKLIEKSCEITNNNPEYRVSRPGNLTKEGIRPGHYGLIQQRPETYFTKLKGHQLYKPPKEQVPPGLIREAA